MLGTFVEKYLKIAVAAITVAEQIAMVVDMDQGEPTKLTTRSEGD